MNKMKQLIATLTMAVVLAGCAAPVRSMPVHRPPDQTITYAPKPHAHSLDYVSTDGRGGERLPFQLIDGVKVFSLEAREVSWEIRPGVTVKAFTYNGTVPGPEIRVTEGDRVRLVIKNSLPEATSLHPHGLKVPPGQDGVPGQGGARAIEPGETGVMEFIARPQGTHWYHSHVNSVEQVNRGMYGSFVVEPKQGQSAHFDREHTVVLADAGEAGLLLNGKSFPSVPPVTVKEGERVRLRFINTGVMAHPMHLHGHSMTVIARDGYPLSHPYEVDTFNIAPGETWDVALTADNPGTWLLHCHILPHAEQKDGMHGMTMLLRYES